jgi:hypothetical protein
MAGHEWTLAEVYRANGKTGLVLELFKEDVVLGWMHDGWVHADQ